jgi:hypothetical protein
VNAQSGPEDETLRDRYFRERRLLLGLSVVLLAHLLLGITVGRSADSLGLHFEIADPDKIWWAVWLLWGWSFICCLQQMNSLRPYIQFPKARRARTLVAVQRRVAHFTISRAVRSSFRRQVVHENRIRWQVAKPTHVSLESAPHLQSKVELFWRNEPEQPGAVGLVDDIAVGEERWIVRSSADGIIYGERRRSGTVAILRPDSRWLWVAATIWTWASTSFLTDYVAPILIGLSPLAAVAFQARRCLLR